MDDQLGDDFHEKTKRRLTESVMGSVSRSNANRRTRKPVPGETVLDDHVEEDEEEEEKEFVWLVGVSRM